MDYTRRFLASCTLILFTMLLGTGCVKSAPAQLHVTPKTNIGFKTIKSSYTPLSLGVFSEINETYALLERLNPTLFNTALLRKPEATRHFLKFLPRHLGVGVAGSTPLLEAPSKKITFTYFDRGSDELVIIGGGFANPREMLAPLLGIFVDYDVVIFDHVGHGIDYKPESLLGWLYKSMLDIDFEALRGGTQEENEILSIVQHFKEKKAYKNLYGVGFCYSTGLFMKTAANHPGIFKKLILDGAWESGEALMKRFADKPELFFDPQRGSPAVETMNIKQKLVYKFYMWVMAWKAMQRHIRGTASELVPNGAALKKLGDTPVLLIHGINDLVISEKQFNAVWNNKEGEKTAILTDSRHLQNHIKYKQLFAWCANCFLDLGNQALEYSLTSPEALAKTYLSVKEYKEQKKNLTNA